jgi:hypothetical protein
MDAMRLLMGIGAAAMALVFASSGAMAQPIDAAYDFELRGGVLAHSVDEPGADSTMGIFNLTRRQDANVELLFKSPDLDAFRWMGSPRPHVGATVNFDGLESMAYFGLTWRAQVFDTPVFVEGSFGGALVDAERHGAIYPKRSLGCNFMFHESASLGYDLTDQASVMLTVEHASHAFLCGEDNRGLTNLGVRVGFKF